MKPSGVVALCVGVLSGVLFWQVCALKSDLESAVSQNSKLLANNRQLAATLVDASHTYNVAAQDDHDAIEQLKLERDKAEGRAMSFEKALKGASSEDKNCLSRAIPDAVIDGL